MADDKIASSPSNPQMSEAALSKPVSTAEKVGDDPWTLFTL